MKPKSVDGRITCSLKVVSYEENYQLNQMIGELCLVKWCYFARHEISLCRCPYCLHVLQNNQVFGVCIVSAHLSFGLQSPNFRTIVTLKAHISLRFCPGRGSTARLAPTLPSTVS